MTLPPPPPSQPCCLGHDDFRRDLRLHLGERRHRYEQFMVYPRVEDARTVLTDASADHDFDDPRVASCTARRLTFTVDPAIRVVNDPLHFVAR